MRQTENRLGHHRATIVGAIAAVHLLLSGGLFFLKMASGMSRFDGAGPSDLTYLLLNYALRLLSFPLLTVFLLLDTANTGNWGWLAFLGNSGLWGWIGWRAIRYWRSRRDGVPGPVA